MIGQQNNHNKQKSNQCVKKMMFDHFNQTPLVEFKVIRSYKARVRAIIDRLFPHKFKMPIDVCFMIFDYLGPSQLDLECLAIACMFRPRIDQPISNLIWGNLDYDNETDTCRFVQYLRHGARYSRRQWVSIFGQLMRYFEWPKVEQYHKELNPQYQFSSKAYCQIVRFTAVNAQKLQAVQYVHSCRPEFRIPAEFYNMAYREDCIELLEWAAGVDNNYGLPLLRSVLNNGRFDLYSLLVKRRPAYAHLTANILFEENICLNRYYSNGGMTRTINSLFWLKSIGDGPNKINETLIINPDFLVAYLNFGGLLSRDHLKIIFGTTNLELISILQHFKVNATTHNFDKIIDSVITNNMCWARTDSILKIVTTLIKMGAKATEKSTNYLAKMGCSSEFRFVVEQGFPIGPACRALALAHGHDDIVQYIDSLKR